jgi:2,3-bisphosphoglycerate-dependent phosphoglycerate mutase
MTRLVLIRHGEAQVHVDGILGGERFCNGLSALGRRQAEALRDRLKGSGELEPVAALYASTLPRARETAEIIAPALGQLDVRPVRELREFDPGDGDGLTWEEFERRFPRPEVFDPHRPRTPSGESWVQFGSRVEAALARIIADHPGETAVVACHGGVIEQAFHLWGISVMRGIAIDIANTGMTELLWADPWPWHQPGDKSWRLVRHNDHAHLANLAP